MFSYSILATWMYQSNVNFVIIITCTCLCPPAAQFLHDNGILLHYNDHLRGLNNLYFIDPVWLADMLAEVITVPQKNSFIQNGILKESNMAFIFHDNRRFPSTFFQQYLQLLERFEIALSLGNGKYLIPSMLPYQRPVMNFVNPKVTPRKSSSHCEEEIHIPSVDSGSISSLPTEDGEKGPRIVDGLEVVDYPVSCIRRRYNMAYVPSGFWSRLISRLIINLKRSGLVEDNSATPQSSPVIYWKRGIMVPHSTGRFLVESINSQAGELMFFSHSHTLLDPGVVPRMHPQVSGTSPSRLQG